MILKKKTRKNRHIPKYLRYFSLYYKKYLKIIIIKLILLSAMKDSNIFYRGCNKERIMRYIGTNYYLNNKKLLYYQTYFYTFINKFISLINNTDIKEVFFTNKYSYIHYSNILVKKIISDS